MWNRYRFKTDSVADWRPLVYNPDYPFWCSGYGDDYAIIVCWLPIEEDLFKYWDDAYDIDTETHEEIKYTSRFPKD